MPFDKPRLFSGDGVPQTGSDPAIGFDLRSELSFQDSLSQGSSSRKTVDEELGLSAELQVLAAHLRGEADALAERYAPALRPTAESAREHRVRAADGFGRAWRWPSRGLCCWHGKSIAGKRRRRPMLSGSCGAPASPCRRGNRPHMMRLGSRHACHWLRQCYRLFRPVMFHQSIRPRSGTRKESRRSAWKGRPSNGIRRPIKSKCCGFRCSASKK